MADTHAISALKAERVKITEEVRNLQGQLRQASSNLDHIEAVLRLLDPTLKIPASLTPKNRTGAAYRGEVSRTILEVLRAAVAPVTTVEMASKVMDAKGLDVNDRALRQLTLKRVFASLKHWEKRRGVVRSVHRPGEPNLWELIR